MDIPNPFAGFDPSVIVDKIYFYGGIFLLLLFIGGVGFAMYHIGKKRKNKAHMKKIGWWQEVSGTKSMEPSHMDEVEEIIMPGTTLRIFYCKKKDLWLPRFSRGVSKDLFYVLLTPTQQMVNFTLKGISADLKNADLEYDHTDMLWAAENAREFIKRNYTDKAEKWWKAYQGPITTAIYILIMTFSLVIIIYFMRGIVEDIGTLISQLGEILKTSCQNSATSGIVSA